MRNQNYKNSPDFRQSSFTLHFAIPHFYELRRILKTYDLELDDSDAEIDKMILDALLRQLRRTGHKEIQREVTSALVEELEVYNDDYLPRNIDQQVSENAKLLFSLEPESLAAAARQCNELGVTEHDEIDPYTTSEIQEYLEQNIPAASELRITVGCYDTKTGEPFAEAKSSNLADSLQLFLDMLENGGGTVIRENNDQP